MKRGIWWLLGSITRHWEVLSPRVSAQHGVELEQKERERKERIERRRRKIEEEERSVCVCICVVSTGPDEFTLIATDVLIIIVIYKYIEICMDIS